MKTLTNIALACLCAGAVFVSCDKNDSDNNAGNTLNTSDRNFISQVSLSNSAEIQEGTLASTTGEDSAVKAFGLMMVTEHTTAQNDLKALGTGVNIHVTDSVDASHTSLLDSLGTLIGRGFDSVYIMSQIADHQAAIAAFQAEISSGSHAKVTDYANKYLPKIQMHLATADSIAASLHFK